jgi:hypothetical protein
MHQVAFPPFAGGGASGAGELVRCGEELGLEEGVRFGGVFGLEGGERVFEEADAGREFGDAFVEVFGGG